MFKHHKTEAIFDFHVVRLTIASPIGMLKEAESVFLAMTPMSLHPSHVTCGVKQDTISMWLSVLELTLVRKAIFKVEFIVLRLVVHPLAHVFTLTVWVDTNAITLSYELPISFIDLAKVERSIRH